MSATAIFSIAISQMNCQSGAITSKQIALSPVMQLIQIKLSATQVPLSHENNYTLGIKQILRRFSGARAPEYHGRCAMLASRPPEVE